MSTSDKVQNKRSKDPVDKAIMESGIRAKKVMVEKKLDLLLVILNNGKVLKLKLSDYPRLKKGRNKQLENWTLIGGGIGIRWEQLDEDLSLKGMIKDITLKNTLRQLENHGDDEKVIA